MTNIPKRYFVCTSGNFQRTNSFLEEEIKNNLYRLHKHDEYPAALDAIQKGDTILLKNNCWIIAYGIATGKVDKNLPHEWCHVVRVDQWHSLNPYNLKEGIHAYGIRDNTKIGGSMSVVKEVDADWAEKKLGQFKSYVDEFSRSKVWCDDRSVLTLLSWKLQIPSYQRGYCWGKERILTLLNDIYDWVQSAKSGATEEKPYFIGTAVIKSGSDEQFDVIDGQQRLLTLALFAFAANRKMQSSYKPLILESVIEETTNEGSQAVGYLVRALNTIETWIAQKIGGGEDKVGEIIDQMLNCTTICVVHLPSETSEDLAYSFFNTTNSTGIRLSDYDLLKTHHLRYVPDSDSGRLASRWNRLSETNSQEELLHLHLYRLRSWCRRESFYLQADDTRSRQLFKHFSVDIPPLQNLYDIPLPLKLDSVICGGLSFFNYVESYLAKLNEFNRLPCVEELTKFLHFHSRGVLYRGIKSILFLYYCRFGGQYIKEALYCIAYRVSELRNEGQVRMSYLPQKDIFRDIVCRLDCSSLPGEFFGWALQPKFAYQPTESGQRQKHYWRYLHKLLQSLENEPDFAIGSATKTFTTTFNGQKHEPKS